MTELKLFPTQAAISSPTISGNTRLYFENEEKRFMLTILAFLIPSLLAIGLFAYLLSGIIIYLHGLYKTAPVSLQSHPSA
ncbi:MAG TPA: hypothetical protein VGC89_07645 [Pyrinomonadaceae bacterium]